MYVCMYVCMYTCVCMYKYMHMCYTHTYTHSYYIYVYISTQKYCFTICFSLTYFLYESACAPTHGLEDLHIHTYIKIHEISCMSQRRYVDSHFLTRHWRA